MVGRSGLCLVQCSGLLWCNVDDLICTRTNTGREGSSLSHAAAVDTAAGGEALKGSGEHRLPKAGLLRAGHLDGGVRALVAGIGRSGL